MAGRLRTARPAHNRLGPIGALLLLGCAGSTAATKSSLDALWAPADPPPSHREVLVWGEELCIPAPVIRIAGSGAPRESLGKGALCVLSDGQTPVQFALHLDRRALSSPRQSRWVETRTSAGVVRELASDDRGVLWRFSREGSARIGSVIDLRTGEVMSARVDEGPVDYVDDVR